jgi:hypothetical protein
MRVCERVLVGIEERLRTIVASGGGADAVERFNDVLKQKLHLRHGIRMNVETKALFPPSVDGRDAQRLRTDWLGMSRVPCAKEGSSTGKGRLRQYRASGDYPSTYWRALHAALVESGADCTSALDELPDLAEAACEYSQAMRYLRLSPEDMRAEGASAVHDAFEAHARRFTVAWRLANKEGTFAAYGFHLWANMPHLFRKWGCMELVSQQGMEGSVGKLSQLLPRIPWHVRGRYENGLTDEEKEVELERRRDELAPPAQKVYEEFRQESMESTTEHLPSKSNDTKFSLKEILVLIDEAIEKGLVVSYEEYVAYWYRFIAMTKVKGWRARYNLYKGNAAMAQAQALRQENIDYYKKGHLSRVIPGTFETVASIMQKARKKAYHEQAKAVRDEANAVVGGRKLIYQR